MKSRILAYALALVCFVTVVRPQEPSQPQAAAPSAPSPGQLSSVDTQGIKNYLLGPGDVIDVRVFGQADMNASAEVDSDGNISSLPFIEVPIPARCRTEKQLQKDIAQAYGKYLKNPQVSVRITERKSRPPATVFGAVRQPTRVQMLRAVRLNEIMAASGGTTERASGSIQILHTEPVMCPAPGEEELAAPINGTKVPYEVVKIADFKNGKDGANPTIRPGDYIIVTEAEPVYVTGSVVAPQGIYMRDQLTLSLAIAMVGGVKKEAKTSSVRVFRQKPGSKDQDTIVVDLSAVRKHQQPDLLLQPYDIVEVGEASPFSGARLAQTFLGGAQSMMTSLPLRVLY